MADKISIDISDLTLGELEEFEKLSGSAIADLDTGRVPASAIIALVFIAQRRENPKYTMKEARSVKLSDIDLGADPTTAKQGETT